VAWHGLSRLCRSARQWCPMTQPCKLRLSPSRHPHNTLLDLFSPHFWICFLHDPTQQGKCGVEIVSGCIDGWITVQDIRRVSEDGKYTTRVHSHSQLTCLEMHPRVPVLATGSVRSFVDVSQSRSGVVAVLLMVARVLPPAATWYLYQASTSAGVAGFFSKLRREVWKHTLLCFARRAVQCSHSLAPSLALLRSRRRGYLYLPT